MGHNDILQEQCYITGLVNTNLCWLGQVEEVAETQHEPPLTMLFTMWKFLTNKSTREVAHNPIWLSTDSIT
jgi:hypothetical protein